MKIWPRYQFLDNSCFVLSAFSIILPRFYPLLEILLVTGSCCKFVLYSNFFPSFSRSYRCQCRLYVLWIFIYTLPYFINFLNASSIILRDEVWITFNTLRSQRVTHICSNCYKFPSFSFSQFTSTVFVSSSIEKYLPSSTKYKNGAFLFVPIPACVQFGSIRFSFSRYTSTAFRYDEY